MLARQKYVNNPLDMEDKEGNVGGKVQEQEDGSGRGELKESIEERWEELTRRGGRNL